MKSSNWLCYWPNRYYRQARICIFFTSLLFATEAMSVILEVGSYKLRKKRIFLMAPIHHHFEKLGWAEQKIVRIFWLISLICAALGMMAALS